MKEWREVFGTEAEQPEEFDTTESPTTVYQRRNIKKATKEDADGKKITGWQREEREMSREEYDRLTLMQEVVASNTTGRKIQENSTRTNRMTSMQTIMRRYRDEIHR